MKTNQEGINIIKRFEGLKLTAYECYTSKQLPKDKKFWTIGYGNTFYENGTKVKEGDIITNERAEELLKLIISSFERQINPLITVNLNSNQYSAIVSLAYNIGVGNLRKSTLLTLVNKGKFTEASNEFDKFVRAGGKVLNGLITRRAVEKQLFLKP